MKRLCTGGFILCVFLLIPSASAETFRTQREIFPPAISVPTVVGIELPPEVQQEQGYRIVTETGFAIAFRTDDLARDLLPQAEIVAAPDSADTIPRTHPGMIRSEGVFSPVNARMLLFRFSFKEEVAPIELTVELASGTIDTIEVRGGMSMDDMHRLSVRPTYGGMRVELPGETLRVIEVLLWTPGRVRIDAIHLLSQPSFLFFPASPGRTYRLLSGGKDEGPIRLFPWAEFLRAGRNDESLAARLGPPQRITVHDDHDGINIETDNCPDRWNYRQEDIDGDGIGDFCDPCPTIYGGQDVDENGRCDALDDPDMDDIPTVRDNCPQWINRLQEDTDEDGIGDRCDPEANVLIVTKELLPWVVIAGLIVGTLIVAFLSWLWNRRSPNEDEDV